MSSNVIPLAGRTARQAPTQRTAPHRTAPTNATPAPVIPITACAVYTVAEVAGLLSLSTGSTYTLVRKGEIPAKKMGGRWVIPKRRFEAWLNDLPEASIEDLERDMRREERRFRVAPSGPTRHSVPPGWAVVKRPRPVSKQITGVPPDHGHPRTRLTTTALTANDRCQLGGKPAVPYIQYLGPPVFIHGRLVINSAGKLYFCNANRTTIEAFIQDLPRQTF